MQRYKKIKIKGRTIQLHRYVWEQVNGPIPDGHVIHHKNGDPYDNRPENLECVTPQQHSEHHNQKHPRVKACVMCGKEFKPHPTKRKRAKTCSRECFKARMVEVAEERSTPEYRQRCRETALSNGSAKRARTMVQKRWNNQK